MRFFLILLLIFITSVVSTAQIEKNIESRYQLALSYEQAGYPEKAELIYRELTDAQPWNNIYFESLNKILISQKKYDQSIELLSNRIKQNPGDLNLFGLLGSTYFILDRPDKAFEIWDSGIAMNPSSVITYRIMANYAIENRAFDKAVDFLNRGKKYSGDPAIFSMDLANIYAANMKFKNAALEFCNLISRHPEQLPAVKARMNSILKGPGAIEQSIEAVKDFIDSNSILEIYDLLTFIYQAAGDYQEAFKNVVSAEKKFNGTGTQIFIFSQDAYRNRQFEWASNCYNYLIKQYPNSPYIATARIGYARTLEASLDQKFILRTESWKPIVKPVPHFNDEYIKIIDSYNKFIAEYPNNSINIEALFRTAEIYRNRLLDKHKADSIYSRVGEISPMSEYFILSNMARGIIAVEEDNLDKAKNFFETVRKYPRVDPENLANADFYLGRIEFWRGNFSNSISYLMSVTKNSSADCANDALELSALINISKKDSINLFRYAQADLLVIQNKQKEAGVEFKTLSDNPNLFVINDFAKNKFAEILISNDDLPTAIKVLEEITQNTKNAIFADKATFLLAECYKYGIKDLQKAGQTYQKLLETFPNSLYFDRAREALQSLPTKNG
ncbi:MAG: hypothetical protein CVV24_04065 [Ignavibacteriae bacterium HGW-Ignavibacteriae-3]|nr:MAG: hypothetical protein CVV24_04065 [Ignavibacteriae bacterium HGW-Ignavibacteriae-3]